MKKTLLLILIAICLMMPLRARILTTPASGTTYVGYNIGFMTDCGSYLTCNWYWGDGNSLLGAIDDTYSWRYHTYRNPGSYIVHIRRFTGGTPPSCGFDEYRTVTILENRSISALPSHPSINQPITFTATNFRTPTDITWDMGDGTILSHNQNIVSHTYPQAGNYLIKAFDFHGDTTTMPVTLTLAFARSIIYSPAQPRVDQQVNIQAVGFSSNSIDWNFGDDTPQQIYSAAVSHQYENPGLFIITANEHGLDGTPVSKAITILPENRSLVLSASEVKKDEPVTVTALNFRGRLIRWDFGDGTVVSGPAIMTHTYKLPGNYIITARDEDGASGKLFQVQVTIVGISDQVNLEIAEISLDNGKYYKVIPKNSKNIKARLKMKMRGTGIVSGYWEVDDKPYQFFNETVYQGQIKDIFTPEIPGLPVFDPGMHTITVRLTRPSTEQAFFPTLRYFVLPYENEIEIVAPADRAVIKEDEIANFSWQNVLGGSFYQIAFSNSLFPLLQEDPNLQWLECSNQLNFTPDPETWKSIKRNQWTYWKVRATDSNKNILGESGIQEIKIIIPGAKVGIQKITDMDGNNVVIGNNFTTAKVDNLLIHGCLTYPGEAEYLILQISVNDNQVDQLLFRDVKKGEERLFETSVPNMEKESRVVFQVLKSSSPSVIIGYSELKLKKE